MKKRIIEYTIVLLSVLLSVTFVKWNVTYDMKDRLLMLLMFCGIIFLIEVNKLDQ
jgi:hypothetical protein